MNTEPLCVDFPYSYFQFALSSLFLSSFFIFSFCLAYFLNQTLQVTQRRIKTQHIFILSPVLRLQQKLCYTERSDKQTKTCYAKGETSYQKCSFANELWNPSWNCPLSLPEVFHFNTLQPVHKITKFSLGLYKSNLVTICVIRQINVSQLREGSQHHICMRFWLFPFQQSFQQDKCG